MLRVERHFAMGLLVVAIGAVGSARAGPADAQTLGNVGADGPLALLGATVIDSDGRTLPDAAVVIRGDSIACVEARRGCRIPMDARRVDLPGRWIIPGLVDAHVHYSQTGWADGRPDAEDVRAEYPYDQTIHRLEHTPYVFGRSYLCAGVTATFDVGGYPWTWNVRTGTLRDPTMPVVAAAGPLLSTRAHWLNLPAERQFIHMAGDSAVDAGAAYLAVNGTDAIKVWFLVGARSDTARLRGLLERAADRAHEAGIPLIVHATGLWDAKVAVENGAHLLVHSVTDQLVDDEFLETARAAGTIYSPTLIVRRGYLQLAARRFDPEPYGRAMDCVDWETRLKVAATQRLPGGLEGDELAAYRRRVQASQSRTYENLRRVRDAGIPIALGTDAGNPLTLHGPAVYPELEAMVAAGLTPAEALRAATYNGALAMGMEDRFGRIAPGQMANLVVLSADPLVDIHHVREVEQVVRAGRLYTRDELRYRAGEQ